MNEKFMKTESKVQENEIINKAAEQFEYGGYQIRIFFEGEKTLAQCVKNLTERKIVI